MFIEQLCIDVLAMDAPAPMIRFAKYDARTIESLARVCFVAICLGATIWLWQTSALSALEKKAAAAAGLLHLFLSISIDLAAVHTGVYRFILTQQLLWGIAIDLHLGWAALWGTGLCLAWSRIPAARQAAFLSALIAITLALDFLALKSDRVFEALRPEWWLWDLAALTALALSTLGFFHLIRTNRALLLRTTLYALMYALMFYVLIPALIIEFGEKRAFEPLAVLKPWSWIALGLVSIPGLWAALQFVHQAEGTPLPLDPTRRLVTNGIYAHIRNPMQLSGLLAGVIWALTVNSVFMWIYVLDLALLFWAVRNFEERELLERFGEPYARYASKVKKWIPRLFPYRDEARRTGC